MFTNLSCIQINNQSIQDLHIFGDPSKSPIITVERVLNEPRRPFNDTRSMELIDSSILLTKPHPEALKNPPNSSHQSTGRDLKLVVFVHGFQVHLTAPLG